jgi:FKBP-type peptidyl-prolyl cis-trans isomerase FklB
VTFETTMRWFVSGAVLLVIVLFVWTALGQEAPTVSKGQQVPASKPQSEAATPSQVQPDAPAAKAEPQAPMPDKSQAVESLIQSRKDKISYAFGVDLARDLKQQRNDLNLDLLIKALTDALADKPLIMSGAEVTATLKKYREEQKQDYEHAKTMIGEKNRIAGESFFSENAKKEGVVTLPSGLQYKVLTKGEGKLPTLDDHVVCNYRGTLLDGREFDSSYKRSQPATLPVKGLIKGWSEALQMMPAGSKWQLFIPPQLAYGEKIVGGIGPNAMLIFEVELLSVQDKPQTASAAK